MTNLLTYKKMKRVLITGATGFVGANLARRLLHNGHDVHLLIRQSSDPWRIKPIRTDVQLHEVDLRDREALILIIDKIRPEWIFNLAVYGAYSWQTDFSQMMQTNIWGTVNLVEACVKKGFEAFINTGSSSEYGFKDHAPSEMEVLKPNSYYAVTKAASTLYCCYIAQSRQVHIPTLRLYSIYGPYEDPSRLLPTLILNGLRGTFPFLASPDNARDYVYIEDAIDAYLLAAMQPKQEFGAVYNVGSGIQTSLRKVVDVAERMFNFTDNPKWDSLPGREWDTTVWVANNQRIREKLKWQPQFNFEQGFQRMVTWFLNNPEVLDYYKIKENIQEPRNC